YDGRHLETTSYLLIAHVVVRMIDALAVVALAQRARHILDVGLRVDDHIHGPAVVSRFDAIEVHALARVGTGLGDRALKASHGAVRLSRLFRRAKVLQRAKRRDARTLGADDEAQPVDVVTTLRHQTERRRLLLAPIASHIRMRKVE